MFMNRQSSVFHPSKESSLPILDSCLPCSQERTMLWFLGHKKQTKKPSLNKNTPKNLIVWKSRVQPQLYQWLALSIWTSHFSRSQYPSSAIQESTWPTACTQQFFISQYFPGCKSSSGKLKFTYRPPSFLLSYKIKTFNFNAGLYLKQYCSIDHLCGP